MIDMNRPKRSEKTKEALITEGIDQLSRHGYHGTGIKQILDAVKVPKGSFYNYFSSKESFVAEILEQYSEDGLQQLDAFTENSLLTPLEQIKTIYDFALMKFSEQSCQQGCLIGSIAAEIGNQSETCQKVMLRSVDKWKSRFAKLLEKGQQQGQIREDLTAIQIADIFWSAWEGSLIRMKMEANIAPAQQLLNIMLDHLLKPVPQKPYNKLK